MAPIDPATLSACYDACAASLVLYARQWLPAAAEDVVQDVFIRLLAQRRMPTDAKAWLFRAVRNRAISHLRSRGRRRRRERGRAAAQPAAFEARPEDLIDARAAQDALESLPAEQREAVVLRIWGGMTLHEASAVMGRPVTTVFRWYRQGLAAIRERMGSACQTKRH